MSLQKLAHHLQSAGRNNDSMLVHMSPREVSGLQALARQHGGDLTINPNTGLVEAGFLDSILPTIAGLGLSLIPGIGPLAAAGIVGGGTAVASGSLEKGLMAGLGAYGGAGIGEGLSGASTLATPDPTMVTPVTPTATPQIPVDTMMNTQNTLGSGFYNTVPESALTTSGAPGNLLSNSVANTPSNVLPSQAIESPVAETFGGNVDKLSSGFGNVTDSMKSVGDFASQNKGSLMMAAAPLAYGMANPNSSLFSKDEVKTPEKTKSTQRPYSFSTEQNLAAYSPGDSTAEQNYFVEPRFTALPTYTAKEGGLMGYAVGGPIENMSAQNAVGSNMMYPQSQLQPAIYSNPMVQRPMPSNVISQGTDTNVDPYSGQERLAKGGVAHYEIGGLAAMKAKEAPSSTTSYKFDPKSQSFTKSVTDYREVIPKIDVEKIQGDIMHRGGASNNMANPYGILGGLGLQKKYEPVTTETQVGGMSQPYQSAAPLPAYKDYRRSAPQGGASQMGDMSGFYSQMNQQLGGFSPETGGLRAYAVGGMADGGYNLGSYSDGGRLLKGPGDGVSDSIPASIGDRQPARLADGEFVVPARIVSELGNGSTDAGARKLYGMMDRVQKQRSKTTGKGKVAVNSKADKYMPA